MAADVLVARTCMRSNAMSTAIGRGPYQAPAAEVGPSKMVKPDWHMAARGVDCIKNQYATSP